MSGEFSSPDFAQVAQTPIEVVRANLGLGQSLIERITIAPPPHDAESQQWMDYAAITSFCMAAWNTPLRKNVLDAVERYAKRWDIMVKQVQA